MSTTFANSIDSNPIYADRAENDKDGNRIDQTYAKSASLATVATTGDYNDLSNKPTLATVATSGSYTDLSNKPTIPSVDQSYNAASTNAQSGVAVAQAIAAIPSTSYTAGDGIDITANEVSVKAGTGLEIADVSGEATENLVSSDITAAYWDPSLYIVRSLCPLTSDLLTKMAAPGGLRVTLQRDFWVGASSVVYACIYTYRKSGMIQTQNRLILGSQLTQTGEYMPTNTVVTFDTNDINSASNVTLQQVQSNISNYRVGLIYDGQPASSDVNSTDTSVVTATYSDAAIILDALCVSNPLPAVTSTDDNKVLKASYTGGVGSYSWETETGTTYSAGTGIDISQNNEISVENPLPASTSAEAGKYLKVDANGDPEWATGGGGGGGVNADWDETDPLEPSYIENKPTPKTLTAGQGISIADGVSTLTISANVTVPVQDVTVDGTSVVSNGVAAITSPTVDQTYDASSVNAQSGVAVAEAISAAVIPISIVSALPANPDPNTLYVVTGA